MSRIGNKAVEIPDKVKVNIGNDGAVAVEGPKGKLQWTLPREIKASVKDNRVSLVRDAETRSVKALHGLSRSLVHNMVQGVSEGFSKNLEIEGVGFKAAVQGQVLNLSLGKSHPILFPIPKEIPRVLGGMGISILSTPRGILSGREAKKQNVGGELLAYVW